MYALIRKGRVINRLTHSDSSQMERSRCLVVRFMGSSTMEKNCHLNLDGSIIRNGNFESQSVGIDAVAASPSICKIAFKTLDVSNDIGTNGVHQVSSALRVLSTFAVLRAYDFGLP